MRKQLLVFFLASALVLTLFSLPDASADRLLVNMTERGKVTSYYDQFWVVQVNGVLTIHNPFNSSFDFVSLPFDLGTLNIIERSDTDYIKPDEIYLPFLSPQQTVTIEYTIRGISAYDPMVDGKGVLYSAFQDQTATLYTFMISKVQKAPVENETIDSSGVKSVAERRLISVSLENPSDIRQNVTSIKVIKTTEQDPNNELEAWHFPEDAEQIVIKPGAKWEEDIIDYNASDGEVYWLSSEVLTDTIPVYMQSEFIKRFTQEDLLNVANASLSEKEYLENVTSYLEHLMYLKKTVSKSLFLPGDDVVVKVKLNNFAPISRTFNLTETMPQGFVRVEGDKANHTSDNILRWNRRANPDSTELITYKLRYVDNETVGLDHFEPAVVTYENETLYSERIPFVRQYIPEKRIFVQKELRYSLNDEIVVSIQVRNMGQSNIEDLYVREFLGANDVFREISIQPEAKGRWRISLLKRGETWEVTYVTNENDAVNLLPEVFGVDKNVVLKTLVFQNVIKNEWIAPAMHVIEILAPLFAIGFIAAYFVYHKRKKTQKKRTIGRYEKDISKLKKETELKPAEWIDNLKRESKEGIEIETVQGMDPSIYARKQPAKKQAKDNLDKLHKIDDDTRPKH